MTGVPVTPEKLRHVEALETILRKRGVNVVRVRLHEEGQRRYLRVEVAPDEMDKVLAARDELLATGLSQGYERVLLDLAGYKTGGATFR
jgi:uncharacterized protein